MAKPFCFRLRTLQNCLAAFCMLPVFSQAGTPDNYHLPSLGSGHSSYANQQEIRLGRAWARRFMHYAPVWHDLITQRYIEQLIARLLPHAGVDDIRLRVLLVENEQFNAFAVPGGVIGVNGGLLLNAPDQDALASVLAHELGHLAQHHFARQQAQADRDMLPTLAGMLAGIVMATRGRGDAGVAAMAGSQAAFMSRQLSYSRLHEQEADRIGLTTLAKAGMAPQAMPRMFDIMMQQSSLQGSMPPEFLLTHPLTASRISDTRLRAAQYPAVPPRETFDFELIKTRALLHFIPDNPDLVRVRLMQNHVTQDTLRYLNALILGHRHRTHEALQQLDALSRDHDAELILPATAAETALQAHQYDDALARAQQLLKRAPDYYPARLIAVKAALGMSFDEAYTLAEPLTRDHPELAEGWQLFAQAAHRSGHDAAGQRAMIEYRQLTGNLKSAWALLESAEQEAIYRHDERQRDALKTLKACLESYQRDDMEAF